MKRFFSGEFFIGCLFIILLSLVPLLWFDSNTLLVGHDNVYPIKNSPFLADRFFTWSEHHGLGYDQSSGMGSIMTHLIDAFPRLFGVTDIIGQRFVYVFWFFAMLVSAFYCGWRLQKDGYVGGNSFKYFFAALYVFNFYTLQAWWIGERTKFSLMVVLPILFVILLRIFRQKSNVLRLSILSAFLLFIFNGGGWRGLPLYGGLFLTLFVLAIYELFFVVVKGKISQLKPVFIYLFLFILFTLLLSMYMTLPFLSQTLSNYSSEISRIGGSTSTFGWIDMISQDASYSNLLRLEGIPEWYTNLDHPYGRQIIGKSLFIGLSFFFIVTILLGFLFKKNKKQEHIFYLFLLVFLSGLLMSAGSHEPFGVVYKTLIEQVPGFAIFRSPIYKFGYGMWFGSSALIAISLSFLVEKYRNSFFRLPFLKYLFVGAIVFGVLLYHFPFLTGNIFKWSNGRLSTKVTIPSYIYEVADWANDKDGRILLLPEANNNWTADIYKWGFYSLYPLMADLSRKPFLYNHDGLSVNERQLVDELYKAILQNRNGDISKLANILGVQYFILRNDYYSDLDWAITTAPEKYKEALKKNKEIIFSQKIGKWDIYEFRKKTKFTPIFVSERAVSIGIDSEQKTNYLFERLLQDFPDSNSEIIIDEKPTGVVREEFIAKKLYAVDCESCRALIDKPEINFPRLLILPNSALYGLFERFRSKVHFYATDEQEVFDILGMTLVRTQEIYELRSQAAGNPREIDPLIVLTSNQMNQDVQRLEIVLNKFLSSNESVIKYGAKIIQYLRADQARLNAVIADGSGSSYLDSVNNVIGAIKRIRIPLEKRVADLGLFTHYYFFPNVEKGYYLVSGNKENLVNSFYINNNNKIGTPSARPIENGFSTIDSNSQVIGEHDLPIVKGELVEEKFNDSDIVESSCFGKKIDDLSEEKYIRVNIGYGSEDSLRLRIVAFPYDESFVAYHFTETELSKSLDFRAPLVDDYYIVKPKMIKYPLFIGVCGQGLTKVQYEEVVKKFDIYKIEFPFLILTKEGKATKRQTPTIRVKKINQTKYVVSVNNASSPYFLSLNEKFNNDWKIYPENGSNVITAFLSKPLFEDHHFMGNRYINSWFIDKNGSYTIVIEYKPQRLFYIGAFLTCFTIIAAAIALIKKNG